MTSGRLLALVSLLALPLAGCDGRAEAAVSMAYMEAAAEAAPDTVGVPVAERLWTWGIGTDITGGDPSPDGRFVSLTDWATSDLAIWEEGTDSIRHVTHKTGWDDLSEGYHYRYSTFSPDGSSLAFTWIIEDERGDYAWAELRTVDSRGSEEPRVILRTTEGGLEGIVPNDWGQPGILATQRAADSIFRLIVVDPETGDSRTVLESPDEIERAVFSPDGRTIAFERADQIRLVPTEGGEARPTGIEGGRIIGWPRDGEGLYFYDRDGDIRVADVRDERTVGTPRLVRRDRAGWAIGASDDALFTSAQVDARRVYVVDVDEDGRMLGEPQPVTALSRGRTEGITDNRSSWPALSPDGQTVAYIQGGRIQVAAPDGSRIRELPVTGVTRELQWGPDGESLWYRRRGPEGSIVQRYDLRSGDPVDVMEPKGTWTLDPTRSVVYERVDAALDSQSGIWAYDYETGERRLVVGLAPDTRPGFVSVSPDGSRLAYLTRDESSSSYRLMMVPVEGEVPREIQRAPGGFAQMTYWTPDGTRVLYQDGPDDLDALEAGVPYRLVSVPVDGGEPTVVSEFEDYPGFVIALNLAAGRMAFEHGWERAELWKTELATPRR